MQHDPSARPLRWIGAIAVLGVISAALVVLAWEAVDESFTFIGDSRSNDAVALASESPAGEESPAPDAEEDDAEADEEEAAPPPATYEVKPGDTGVRIARELFGRQDAWDDIAAYNDISPSATLTVGQVLRIPDLTE